MKDKETIENRKCPDCNVKMLMKSMYNLTHARYYKYECETCGLLLEKRYEK